MAIATQRLYLDADGNVVLHGDPRAATLLVAVGQEMPAGYAEPEVKQVLVHEDKQVAKPANKQVK